MYNVIIIIILGWPQLNTTYGKDDCHYLDTSDIFMACSRRPTSTARERVGYLRSWMTVACCKAATILCCCPLSSKRQCNGANEYKFRLQTPNICIIKIHFKCSRKIYQSDGYCMLETDQHKHITAHYHNALHNVENCKTHSNEDKT